MTLINNSCIKTIFDVRRKNKQNRNIPTVRFFTKELLMFLVASSSVMMMTATVLLVAGAMLTAAELPYAFADHSDSSQDDGHCDLIINPPTNNANYTSCNFVGVNFGDIIIENAIFDNANLENAIFGGGSSLNGSFLCWSKYERNNSL
ncbi:pentapeptide repeat-containing protein [Nitrosopumilus sp.]|uniref:pentapeptide repeat-containing protein n=1 Tax=Nitrosopumilus sp. TaxID=2024843 RepID=UPI003B5C0903